MKRLPRLRLLLLFYAVLVALFALAKPAFMLFNGAAGRGLTFADYAAVVWHGLPLDLATAGYLTAPVWLGLIATIWLRSREARPVLAFLTRAYIIYTGVIALLLAVIYVADACLYGFWDIKLDGTVLGYLDSPRGAAASVSAAYIAAAVAAILLAAGAVYLLLRRLVPGELTRLRRPAAATGGMLLLGGLLFLGIRGGTGKSTANVGMVYYSTDQFLNHSAVNPAFSIFSSLFKTEDFAKRHDYYPEAERRRLFEALAYSTASVDADTLLVSRRPNVLIILMEGCGGTLVNAVDPEADPAVTPCLNRLAREGVFFSRCYANSFRTDRGTVCALSGYPAFPDASVMKLPAKCAALPSIARTLREAGYETSFLYGGDINFTNTKGYLLSTGYADIAGDDTFTPAERATHNWGVTDSITFERLYRTVTAAPPGRPWHTTLLTLASHEPWGVPYSRIKGDTIANAFAYLDHCIGRFIDRLRRTPQWNNTLVIILPDHGIGYPAGITDDNPRKSHIPMIWTGGAVRGPRVVDKICNQTDLAATLLGQLGLPHNDFRFSRDVMSATYTRPSAVHVWSEGIFYMDTTGITVVNLLTKPQSIMRDLPAPSPARAAAANAFLQTAYDALGALGL